MKQLFTFILLAFSLSAYADVVGQFHFEGTLGDKIGVSIEFAVNGDNVAVGEIIYTNSKKPIRFLIVGVWTEEEYLLNEYKADGTVTGCMRMKIDDKTYNEPTLTEGSWTNPKTGKVYEMKNMSSQPMSANNPWDYGNQQTIEGDYAFHQWDAASNTKKGGQASFRWDGDHRLRFEIVNDLRGSSLKNNTNRPAELIPYTYNDFYYENANDCGYGFSAHFFKKFVVLITTSEPSTASCGGKRFAVDGVYMRIDANASKTKNLSDYAE